MRCFTCCIYAMFPGTPRPCAQEALRSGCSVAAESKAEAEAVRPRVPARHNISACGNTNNSNDEALAQADCCNDDRDCNIRSVSEHR